MKSKLISILGLSLLFVSANALIGLAQQNTQQLTKQIKPDIESLPNADYLYGDSPLSVKVGGRYLYFRKNGKNITGLVFSYKSPGPRYCFSGSANRNIINGITTAERIADTNQWTFRPSSPFYLDNLYKISSDKVATDSNAQIDLPECIRVFYYGRRSR